MLKNIFYRFLAALLFSVGAGALSFPFAISLLGGEGAIFFCMFIAFPVGSIVGMFYVDKRNFIIDKMNVISKIMSILFCISGAYIIFTQLDRISIKQLFFISPVITSFLCTIGYLFGKGLRIGKC